MKIFRNKKKLNGDMRICQSHNLTDSIKRHYRCNIKMDGKRLIAFKTKK